MQKEIISIDEKAGMFRVTTEDERWYTKLVFGKESGLPTLEYRPSVTWISEYYPKGIGFYKWLAEKKNWDEAQALKEAAGEKGSRIHKAIEELVAGNEVRMDQKFRNRLSDSEEALTVEEWEALMAFSEWANKFKPEFLMKETVVSSDEYHFAGTVDAVAKIGEDIYIIDWKTGQYIWPSYHLQLSAYKQALKEMGHKTEKVKLAILQVGYRGNRTKVDGTRTMWKFTEIPDRFDLFLSAREIWKNECEGKKPLQRDFPMTLKIEQAQPKEVEKPKAPKATKSSK